MSRSIVMRGIKITISVDILVYNIIRRFRWIIILLRKTRDIYPLIVFCTAIIFVIATKV